MRDEQRFELAIIETQTHCEMHVRENVELIDDRHGAPFTSLIAKQRNWTLLDPVGEALFEALLGRPPSEFEEWEKYKLHIVRRNHAVHRGVRFSRGEAEESIATAVRMVRFVETLREDALEQLLQESSSHT